VAQFYRLNPRITSGFRSISEQQILFDRRQAVLAGRLPPSAQRFPVARPGSSAHNFGLAVDFVVDSHADWLGAVWANQGFPWTARDRVHFGAF